MQTATDIVSELKKLVETKRALEQEMGQIRYWLNNLPSHPQMAELLEKRANIEETTAQLEEEKQDRQEMIVALAEALQHHNEFGVSPEFKRIQKEFVRLLTPEVDRLITEESSTHVVEEIQMVIRSVTSPPQMLAQEINKTGELLATKQVALAMTISEGRFYIESLTQSFKGIKKGLSDLYRKMEAELPVLQEKVLVWATQDREHLECALEQKCVDRDTLLRRYKDRFPSEIPPGTFSAPTSKPKPAAKVPKKKNGVTKTPVLASEKPELAHTKLPEWRFFVTWSVTDPGMRLPSDRREFARALDPILEAEKIDRLDPYLVHEKLMGITSMSLASRQTLKTLGELRAKDRANEQWTGWKIRRTGQRRRLFAEIDEVKKTIRFTIQRRKDAYGGH